MLTAKEFLDNDIIMKVFQMSELSELDKEIILAASSIHDLAKPSSYAQAFVHMCDYIVSKKTLDTVENISLPGDVTPELIKWFETQV